MHLSWVKCVAVLYFLLNMISMVAPVSSTALDYKWKCFHKIATAWIIQPGFNDCKTIKNWPYLILINEVTLPFKSSRMKQQSHLQLIFTFLYFGPKSLCASVCQWTLRGEGSFQEEKNLFHLSWSHRLMLLSQMGAYFLSAALQVVVVHAVCVVYMGGHEHYTVASACIFPFVFARFTVCISGSSCVCG